MSNEVKKIYHRASGQFFEVSEELYYSYYRDIWAEQKRAYRRGECSCPPYKLWICDADCVGCQYRQYSRCISLDAEIERCGDRFSYSEDAESLLIDEIEAEGIKSIIQSLNDTEKLIFKCVMQEITERNLAKLLGISPAAAHQKKVKLIKKISTLYVSKTEYQSIWM